MYRTSDVIYKECEESYKNWNEFSIGQKEQIVAGYQNGLTAEQVKTYARTDLRREQMQEIRWGLKDGLTVEQAEEIASHPENDEYKMFDMVKAFLA